MPWIDSDFFITDQDQDHGQSTSNWTRRIRPKEKHIIQLQMDDLDSYLVYINPDVSKEFDDPQILTAWLRRYTDDELIERALTVASNYKLANIDTKLRTVYPVLGYNKLETW